MTEAAIPLLGPAYPEILMAVGALALLLIGLFSRADAANGRVSLGAVLVLAGAFVLTLLQPMEQTLTFGDMFVTDGFTRFAKAMVFLASALAILMSSRFMQAERISRFEYPVLILLATLGMGMMISANDLMSLYVGLELHSLALYVLAAIRRDSTASTEAGLKYFVLGALASGMLLYGCSLVYGFTGTTNFVTLATVFGVEGYAPPIGLIFGIVFLAAGLAFKVSAVPFHMWTPDVYEGAPTPVTAFFAIAPKIAALILFTRVVLDPFAALHHEWQQIIVFLSLASMIFGAVAGVIQTNIKRLMAYSSIGHAGYALIGLAAGTQAGVQGLLIYLAIYLVMNIGAFGCIISMRKENGAATEEIGDLAGLAQTRPVMAAAFAIFLFSLAGIPPLAGFFAKFYIFIAALDAGLYWLAILGVLASVIGAYYYLRIIKVMYFDAPAVTLEAPRGRAMSVILAVSAIVTICFFVMPSSLTVPAEAAAAALLP